MRKTILAAIAATALAMPGANAASTALVIPDPTGDANFSGLHGQALPGSQPAFDIVSATLDTTKATTVRLVRGKRIKSTVPTGIVFTLKMAAAPSTAPSSSYGISANHSVCGGLRMQIYYSPTAAETYGDLQSCGNSAAPGETNPERFRLEFTPKIVGNSMVIAIPFKLLPKQFKVGTMVDELVAYTSTAEFLVAGYQPPDFVSNSGIDIAETDKVWKVA